CAQQPWLAAVSREGLDGVNLPDIASPAALGPAYRFAHDLPGVLMSVCGPVANGVPKTDNGTRNGKHTKVCQHLVRTYPAFDGSCFPIHIRLQIFTLLRQSSGSLRVELRHAGAREATSTFKVTTPVRLPSGRLRLVTRLSWTGSTAMKNTIGIVVIAVRAASTAGVLVETMTVT